MKKVFLLSLVSVFSFAQTDSAEIQDTGLEQLVKMELGTRGLTYGIEYPLAKNLLLDAQVGAGPVISIGSGQILAGLFTSISPVALAKVNYVFNRDRRARKGRRIGNNAGTFFGYQIKYSPNNWNKEWGQNIINQIHFGQQLPLNDVTSINYHIGVGYVSNLTTYKDMSGVYPVFGISFNYHFD